MELDSTLADELIAELVAVERTLWTNNATAYGETLLPDALLIFPEVGRIDRDAAVAAIKAENAAGRAWAEVSFADVVARWIVDGSVALLTYQATARWNDERDASRTLCATTYVSHGGRWRVAFGQQTAM